MSRTTQTSTEVVITDNKAIHSEHSYVHRLWLHAFIAIGAAVVVFAIMSAQSAKAATITVTTNLDNSAVACTLRNAIRAANNNATTPGCTTAGSPAGDTIVLSATGTITLYTALPVISSTITMVGPGSAKLAVMAAATTTNFIIFDVTTNFPFAISGFTIMNASSNQTHGGAIHVHTAAPGAPMTVNDMVFRNNHGTNSGGAIDTHGALTVTNSVFDNNYSGAEGGAISFNTGITGSVYIVNNLFTRNTSLTGVGNAIASLQANNTRNVSIINNTISSPTLVAGSAIAIGYGTSFISNTIIATATVGISHTGSITNVMTENYNLFYNVTTTRTGTISGGSFDVIGDPKFISPTVSATANYHIGAGSAAIDKGITLAAVTTDYDGDPRPIGVGTDIGFDEAVVSVLSMVKSASASLVKPGDTITYTLVFTNAGPATATVVRVTDTVPTQVISLTYSTSGVVVTSTGATSYVFQVANLAALSTGTIRIVGVISPALTSAVRVTNTASIGSATATTTTIASAGGVDISIPPLGLTAINDSPTQLGSTTYLTATITAGTNVTYTWDLGDGDVAYGANVSDIYTAVGVYTATVTASNSVGTAVTQTIVTIVDVPIADLAATNDSPTQLGSVTYLTATISAGTNVTYTWDLGDGDVAYGANVSDIYTAVGVYTATVTASNGAGSVFTTTIVTIIDVPILNLVATNDSPTQLGSVTYLTATIDAGTNVTYTWDLGDSDVAYGANVSDIYTAVGVYTATVTATNSVGTAVTQTIVTIVDVPIADLVATNDSPTELGSVTYLTATISAGTNVTYTWDLGDGDVAYGANVSDIYTAVGVYTATVTATNSVGTVFTQTIVTIIDVPIAGLTASNSSPHDLGVTTDFTATISAGTNVTYTWDFGDGGSGDGLNPSHTYTDSGVYIVTVTAWNGRGFVTATTTVTVYDDLSHTLIGLYTADKTGAYLADEIKYTFVVTNNGHFSHGVSISGTIPTFTVLTGTIENGSYLTMPLILGPRNPLAPSAEVGFVVGSGSLEPGESMTMTFSVVVGWTIFVPGQRVMLSPGAAWVESVLNYEHTISVDMLPKYRVYLMNLTADNPDPVR